MTVRFTLVLMILVALSACDRRPSRERQLIRRYLLCEECSEGELDSVLALKERAVAPLGEALAGPPIEGRTNVAQQAEAMFVRIGVPSTPRAMFIEEYVGNYVASYQARAAIALARLDTPRSRAMLLAALRNDSLYRFDVLQTIGGSSRTQLSQVDSLVQSAPADSFTRSNPAVVVTQRRDSTLDSLSNVRVAFVVESGGGRVSDSLPRTDAAGQASVRWQLGPLADQVNVLRATAAGQVVRFRAMARGPAPRLVFTVQPSQVRRGELMRPDVEVAVLDSWGDTLRTAFGSVRLIAGPQHLSIVDSLVNGKAIFRDLRLGVSGAGFTLEVESVRFERAVSAPFDVLP